LLGVINPADNWGFPLLTIRNNANNSMKFALIPDDVNAQLSVTLDGSNWVSASYPGLLSTSNWTYIAYSHFFYYYSG
jgi:hypothetical protein